MKRISIFAGFKIAEIGGLCILISIFAVIGYILDQLIDGIGHECQYSIQAFPDFLMFALFGVMLTAIGIGTLLILAFVVTLLYHLIKKNWEWAGRIK